MGRGPTTRAACPRAIGDLDLDPGVLDVEHAAGEAMADEQVADHDVERDARARHDRRAVGGQVPARALRRLDPRAGDVDRRGALELGAAVRRRCSASPRIDGHPRVTAEEAVRRDRAVPSRRARSRDAGSRSMWQSMQVFCSTLSTRAMPLPVHAELRHMPGSSRPDRCTGIAHVGRQEAAVAADAQLGAERFDRDLLLVARDRRRVAERRRIDRRARPHVAAVAVLGRALDAVAQPARHAGVRAQIGRRDRRVGGHQAVDHQRHVVTAAAVLARRLAELVRARARR